MKEKILQLLATKQAENVVLALELAKGQKIELGEIDLSFSDLEGADLEGSPLEEANLEGANLIFAYLAGANL